MTDQGYENPELAKVVVEKNLIFRDQLFKARPTKFDFWALRTLTGLGLVQKQEINVIDFGGGGGNHYFIAKAAFREKIWFRWNIVETSAMVKEARRLEDGELKFFDDIDLAVKYLGKVDLVFSSGTLCCVLEPYLFLQRLTQIRAEHMFITRMPLTTAAEQMIIQTSKLSDNGPGLLPQGFIDRQIQYPITFLNQQEFERALGEKYSIKLILNENESVALAAGGSIDMFGYFCELK